MRRWWLIIASDLLLNAAVIAATFFVFSFLQLRRLAVRSGNAIGSVFWGGTGIAIGLAFSVGAYWFAVMATR